MVLQDLPVAGLSAGQFHGCFYVFLLFLKCGGGSHVVVGKGLGVLFLCSVCDVSEGVAHVCQICQ